MKSSVETKSFFREDECGRRVELSFTKTDEELSKIRVCTFFENGVKFRADYYKEDKEFETIRDREFEYLISFMRWITDQPRVKNPNEYTRMGYTAQTLK